MKDHLRISSSKDGESRREGMKKGREGLCRFSRKIGARFCA